MHLRWFKHSDMDNEIRSFNTRVTFPILCIELLLSHSHVPVLGYQEPKKRWKMRAWKQHTEFTCWYSTCYSTKVNLSALISELSEDVAATDVQNITPTTRSLSWFHAVPNSTFANWAHFIWIFFSAPFCQSCKISHGQLYIQLFFKKKNAFSQADIHIQPITQLCNT